MPLITASMASPSRVVGSAQEWRNSSSSRVLLAKRSMWAACHLACTARKPSSSRKIGRRLSHGIHTACHSPAISSWSGKSSSLPLCIIRFLSSWRRSHYPSRVGCGNGSRSVRGCPIGSEHPRDLSQLDELLERIGMRRYSGSRTDSHQEIIQPLLQQSLTSERARPREHSRQAERYWLLKTGVSCAPTSPSTTVRPAASSASP